MSFSNIFLKSYQYVMDIILLYIVLCLLYIHTTVLPPILPFLIIAIVGASVMVFLLSKLRTNTPVIIIMLTIPVLAYISSLLGIGFGVSFFLASFVCYRIFVHFQKSAKLTDSYLLIVSLLVGGIVYFAADVQGYKYKDIILYLIITHLLFLMIGKLLTAVMNSTIANRDIAVKKQSSTFVGLFSGLFVATIVISVVFPFLFTKLLSFIMTGLGYGLAFISKPLFDAVDKFDTTSRRGNRGPSDESTLIKEESPYAFEFLRNSDSNIWMILSIVAVIILGIIFILIGKRRFIKKPELAAETYSFSTTTETIETTYRGKERKKKQAPQVKVRKLMYEMEIMASAKGLGRYHYENVREWLMRNSFLDDRLVELYEKVRYGDVELSEDENASCEEIAKQIKSKIRSLKRKK